ncbi:MAG: adenylate/guanylate cyclase domain-containing protein [Actinomycetota bacterium]
MLRWLLPLSLPLIGLALLLARPQADAHWEHHPSHFWLVLIPALVSVVLGYLAGEAARRLRDARLFLVSLAFITSAGFLGLHALATPGVLLAKPNEGFVVATPIGLLIAGLFAAASAVDLSPEASAAIMRRQALLRGAVFTLLGGWAAYSLAGLPPLDSTLSPAEAHGPLYTLAALGVPLYAYAAARYLLLYRRRPASMPLAVATAFTLLAEAMTAIALGRNWHASWWEWHALMAAAFGIVALAARNEYRRRRSTGSVFKDLYLGHTGDLLGRRYADALSELAESNTSLEAIRERDQLSEEEASLLEHAAGELKRLDELFSPYLSPQLVARLRDEPGASELGGEEREVSVLFADLQGFTAFSERSTPSEVVGMLNAYWAKVVPVVSAEDGMIERFAGDAVMVVFNAAADQPDHALRAARAALAFAAASEAVAAGRPDWPRFRVGVNSGPAVIGNVGAAEHHSFTAIGDTTNLAARLQAAAEPGLVVIGPATHAALVDLAVIEPLGPLDLKGKSGPVEAFVLVGLSG